MAQNGDTLSRSVLDEAAALVKEGNVRAAKARLDWVLKREPNNALAWLWMSRCLRDRREILNCYYRVLSIDPTNPHAKQGIRQFEGRSGAVSNQIPRPSAPAAQEPRPPLSQPLGHRWRFLLLLGLPSAAIAVVVSALLLLPTNPSRRTAALPPTVASSQPTAPCDLSDAISFETFLIDRETALVNQLHQVMGSPDSYSSEFIGSLYQQARGYRMLHDGPAVPYCFNTVLADSLAHSRRAADRWIQVIIAVYQDDLNQAEQHYDAGLDESSQAGDSFAEVVCQYDLSQAGSQFAGVCRLRQHLIAP